MDKVTNNILHSTYYLVEQSELYPGVSQSRELERIGVLGVDSFPNLIHRRILVTYEKIRIEKKNFYKNK